MSYYGHDDGDDRFEEDASGARQAHGESDAVDARLDRERSLTVQEYGPTSTALADLRARYANLTFPVETAEGMAAAKEARKSLAGYRTRLENLRKKLKAPALEHTRLIDSEAKVISVQISALEDPIARQIQAEESRIERERQEREEAERGRQARIQAAIEEIHRLPVSLAGASAAAVAEAKHALIVGRLESSWLRQFDEYAKSAQGVAATTILALTELLDARTAAEAEAARVAADRAELAHLRADREEVEQLRAAAEQASHDGEDEMDAAGEAPRFQAVLAPVFGGDVPECQSLSDRIDAFTDAALRYREAPDGAMAGARLLALINLYKAALSRLVPTLNCTVCGSVIRPTTESETGKQDATCAACEGEMNRPSREDCK